MSAHDPQRAPSRSTTNWRAQYRSRSHDSAHAEAALAGPAPKLPELPLVPRGPAKVVNTAEALQELIAHLRAAKCFAYDSEFIGELTYLPKLCLIQVASAEQVALIDPLAGLDLMPFWELLCDPAVEKVVHAGQQDIEPVFRHTGHEAAHIFDTQIAAAFASMTYPVSLSKLVQELLGVRLGKGLTFSHWDQRPLSAIQLRYAADDVRYLPAVRQAIGQRLEANGHLPWAQEESAALCNAALYRFDPQSQYLRVRGASSLPPRGLAILRNLTVWRDAAARADDVPPRAFLKDEILLELSRTPPDSVEKLKTVRGLPRPVEQAHGPALIQTIQEARKISEPDLPAPRHAEESASERFRADALWAAAQCLCSGQGVDPALVTSRQEIGELCRRLSGGNDVADLRLLRGWRGQAAGGALVGLFQGVAQFTVHWAEGGLQLTREQRT